MRRPPRLNGVRDAVAGRPWPRPADELARSEAQFCLLHADPVVVYAPDWAVLDPSSAVWTVLGAQPSRRAFLIAGASWDMGGGAGRLASRLRTAGRQFPHVAIAVACATAEGAARLRALGLEGIHSSPSALAREDLYTPHPGRRPTFDAIYDARWTGFKRHRLACRIPSLALIAPASYEPDRAGILYSIRGRLALRRATWIASPWGSSRRRLSAGEVAEALNRARVGLCLSCAEGAMRASVQYLLAGLPVVTTHNSGGRDEFFDPKHVRWVDPDPRAVAAAVAELIALELDPVEIRHAVLERIGEHRERLQAWVRQAILSEGGDLGRWAGGWPQRLPNKLFEPPAGVAGAIAEIAEALSRGGSASGR